MIGSIRRTAIAVGLALMALALVIRSFGGIFARRQTIKTQKRQIEAYKDRERIERDVDQDVDLVERARRSGVVRK